MVCITYSYSFVLIYYAFGSPIQYFAGKLISAWNQNFIFQFTEVMNELCWCWIYFNFVFFCDFINSFIYTWIIVSYQSIFSLSTSM